MAKAKLIELKVHDSPGTVAAATAALSAAGINILSIFGWGPQGVVQLVVDNPRKAMKALATADIAYSEGKAEMVEVSSKPGGLHAYLQKLAKKGVNLRSISGISSSGRKSVVVWTQD
jgi:hypothetical protein